MLSIRRPLTLIQIGMATNSLLYIGSQNPQKMGIAVAELDTATGALSVPGIVMETRDPAHLTLSASHGRLYICNTGTPGGVSAFAVADRKTGELKPLNFKVSEGRGPSYVSLDASGRYVLDANYGGGFVEVFALMNDGALGPQTAFVRHQGSSVHPQRQTRPYAHWIRTDPSNRFALVADLGTDRIVVYRFDVATGSLTPNDPPAFEAAPGSGPRHLAFHPNHKWVYAVQELSNEVLALQWDATKGVLTQFQAVKTLPEGFVEPNTAAEIAVRSDGKFLYASNRGHDSIVVYAIDGTTGELTRRQHVPSRGKTPRFFTFDPSDRWLVVANQEGGSLTVFSVDEASGVLTPHGEPVPIVNPMGVAFL